MNQAEETKLLELIEKWNDAEESVMALRETNMDLLKSCPNRLKL